MNVEELKLTVVSDDKISQRPKGDDPNVNDEDIVICNSRDQIP